MNTISRRRTLVSEKMLLALVGAAAISLTILHHETSIATGTIDHPLQSSSYMTGNEALEETIWSDAIRVKNHSGYVGEVASAGVGVKKLTGSAPLRVTLEADKKLGAVEAYRWNFGDGDAATGPVASHMYTDSGTYLITLEALKDTGDTQKEQITVTVTSW